MIELGIFLLTIAKGISAIDFTSPPFAKGGAGENYSKLSKYFSASKAAMQPEPAEVMAWR